MLSFHLAHTVRLFLITYPTRRSVAAHRPNRAPVVFREIDDPTFDDPIPGFRLPLAELFR